MSPRPRRHAPPTPAARRAIRSCSRRSRRNRRANAGAKRILLDRDRDLFRDERRVERIVVAYSPKQRRCVLARRRFDRGFGLPRPEMQMVLVLRDRLVGIERLIHIDQQMMMTAVL